MSDSDLYDTADLVYFCRKAVSAGNIFGIRMHPFNWNHKTKKVEYVTDRRALYSWYVGVFWVFAYYAFAVIRVIEANLDANISLRTLIFINFNAVFCTTPPVIHTTLIFVGHELPAFINGGPKLLRDCEVHGKPKLRPGKRSFVELWAAKVFGYGIYYSCTGLGIAWSIMGVLSPENKIFISSITNNPETNYSVRLLAFLLAIYEMALHVTGIFITFAIPGSIFLRLLLAQTTLGQRERIASRRLVSFKIYRMMELYMKGFNRIIGSVLLPFAQIFLTSMSVFGLVGLLRLSGMRRYFLAAVGVVTYSVLIGLIKGFAQMLRRSENVLNTWKRYNVYPTHDLRFLKPIAACVGSFAFVDNGLALTVTDMVVSQTITVVLTLS